MASFFRKFVLGFSDIARPLNDLLKKEADVVRDWSDVHDQAMEQLKAKLASAPVLTHDDGFSQLELQTDASGKGLGAVLYLIRDEVKKPIAFASRRLDGAEERYHINELEFLALLWALKRFQHHVYGRNVLVKTDSSVVKWVIERADATKNDRLRRWLMELRGFDISVQHLKGASNTVADALSRSPVEGATEEDYIVALIPLRYEPRDLAIMQYADEEIKKVVLMLQEIGERPFEDTSEFVMREGILYRRNYRPGRQHLLVVPSCMRQDLIRDYHDMPVSGHRGREKTLARLSQRFYWRGMEKSVKQYVRSCSFCQLFKIKGGRKAGKLCPIKPPRHVYEQIGIDHLGPFKTTERGNQHLIVCIDYLTRYLEVKAVPSTDSAAVVRFLKNRIFLRHGVPSYIISDAGTAYSSHEFHDFVEEWRVLHFMASVEHAATNGLVEKANGSLTSTFAAFVNLDHDDWDEKIPDAVFAMNTAKQATVKISPFELVYGRTPVMSVDLAFPFPEEEPERRTEFFRKIFRWRKVARQLILRQQARSKKLADKYRSPNPVFHKGDLVIVFKKRGARDKTKKLLPRAIGPYMVKKKISSVCYQLEDIPHNKRSRIHRIFNAHVSIMKLYVPRRECDWEPWVCDEPEEGVREDFFDEQWSDEEDEGHLPEVPDDEGAGEGDFVTYNDDPDPYLVDEDREDDKEESRLTERIELPPSRFGRTRWANPKYT